MKKKLIIVCVVLGLTQVLIGQVSLTPDMYRERVLAYSQVLKQAHESKIAASAAKGVARTGYLPKLDFSAQGTLDLKELDKWDGAVGEYRNHTYYGQLTLSQPLYMGGAVKAQNKVASEELLLAELSEELSMDQIVYQAEAVYWQAAATQALLDAAEEYRRIVEEQHRVISDRFEDGLISKTDLLMISTRQKEAELQYITARKNHTLSMYRLHTLMGEDPEKKMEILAGMDEQMDLPAFLELDEVLGRRAEFKSAQANIRKSEALRSSVLSKFNPQLSMFVTGGWGSASPNLGLDPAFAAITGLNLSFPVFHWGERLQTDKQYKAYVTAQKLQESLAIDQIKEELAGARAKIQESMNQVRTARENIGLAEENLDLVTFTYNEGKASIVDVLSAQLSWTQAKSNVVNAWLGHKLALAEYKKVVSY